MLTGLCGGDEERWVNDENATVGLGWWPVTIDNAITFCSHYATINQF